jgi:hypothetical protein
MQRAFFPGSVDYEGSMSRDFNSGRALSSHSLAVWRAALEPHIGRADNALDLGSGTGRFAVLIADTTLALMANKQFSDRQAALEAAAARETEPTPVFDTLDLLVLRRLAK